MTATITTTTRRCYFSTIVPFQLSLSSNGARVEMKEPLMPLNVADGENCCHAQCWGSFNASLQYCWNMHDRQEVRYMYSTFSGFCCDIGMPFDAIPTNSLGSHPPKAGAALVESDNGNATNFPIMRSIKGKR